MKRPFKPPVDSGGLRRGRNFIDRVFDSWYPVLLSESLLNRTGGEGGPLSVRAGGEKDSGSTMGR